VIFCRNVLIYLIPTARASLLATIDRVLKADGILLIGHADRLDLAGAENRFTPAADPGCFAFRRLACGELALPKAMPALEAPQPILSLLAPAPMRATEATNAQKLATDTDETIVPTVVNAPIPVAVENPLLLDQAADLANKGRFSEAIAVCEQHLRQKGLTAPAYYLMGMICQAAGDHRRAEDCFQKTVYLDPRHAEALLALALLAERRGDQVAATGFHRRAARSSTGSSQRVN
jgi:chemotaxis protein methyltransferase WspC